MGEKHLVRFEPVGIEIEVDEDKTILRAAAEQGIMLMHGCKEGQCSSCKSFILDGDDIEYERYSTFALPDFEKEEGFTLLCRAHPYEDLTIELLNYDEEMIHSGLPIEEAVVEVVSNENVTHDMRHLVVRLIEPASIKFFPGQYVDFHVPGTEETRSFSMANISSLESGQLEFVIKVYPNGLFSEFLDTEVKPGDRLDVTGPFGVFTLRDAPDSDLVFVGEGPGGEEDKQGIPFVGRAGQLLTKLIAGIGMTRDDVYIANVVKCRPPGNRDPLPLEIESCRPYLEAQLGFIRNAHRVWASDASQPALDRALAHLLELTFDAVSSTIDVLDELGPLAEMADHADLEQDVVMARLRAAIEAAKQRLEAGSSGVVDEVADAADTKRYGDGDDTQISSTD